MIRVVAFLVLAGLAAAGAVWLADRPGDIAITWLGYRIDTSMMVALAALALIVVAAMILWSAVRLLLRSPRVAATAMRERRERKGYEAISRGLIAVGAGDTRAALRYAGHAERNAGEEPLALLLRAQTAQLSGNRAAADAAFRAMAERADMQLLGLRGLFVEAQRRADFGAARGFAEQAVAASPTVGWANQAVLEFRCAAADWTGALAILEINRKSGVLDRDSYRRQRAVLLTARALAAEEGDRDAARTFAVDAVKFAPDLVPAAALAGRLLAEVGQSRKAGKILETAWKQNPHPDLAETYAHLRISDSARDRLARVERLAREGAGDREAALAVARAALDAREFATARAALAPLAEAPTQRVAVLMAELEKLEHNDEGRAREWMARAVRAARDPSWTADGFVSDRWLPVSPVTGRLDAFQWKVPLAELGRPPEEHGTSVLIDAPREERPREVVSPPLNGTDPPLREPAAPPPSAAASARPARPVPPIIPLAHVPDDPGPEPEAILDVGLASEPPPAGWQRIRQLFR
jgi:HemY protein